MPRVRQHSLSFGVIQRRFGDVAKWSKAAVCKTAIHRFESGRRLHLNVVIGGWAGVVERFTQGT